MSRHSGSEDLFRLLSVAGTWGKFLLFLGGMDLLQGAAIALFLCEGLRLEGRGVKAPGQEAAWVCFSRSLG